MAIRNVKLGGTNLGEEAGVTDDWNDTFDAAAYRRISNDATGGSNNTTTPTLIVTHAIAAGEVKRFIELNIDKKHIMQDDQVGTTQGAKDYYIRVDIGETGSETTKITYNDDFDVSGDNVNFVRVSNTQKYYYEPTSSEKTNGFNVKIYLYLGNINTLVSSAASVIGDSWIMGA